MTLSFQIFLFGMLVIVSTFSFISPVFGEDFGDLSGILTNDSDITKGNEHLTRPTFGLSHENQEKIVENGFKFNNQTFTLRDNFHTPFAEQSIELGELNSFEATVYSQKGLQIQEFLFGIPKVGEAHLAELGIEVWYGYEGNVERVFAVQKSNVIDKQSLIATGEKIKCKNSDVEENCNNTKISMTFLEPLKDKVMAIKAIDYKNRYHITYLNDGFNISDESLNPMPSVKISSNIKGEGPIQVTQSKKYSIYWTSEDGRIYERNSFGSFQQINKSFDRFQDSGEPRTRLHSGFGGVLLNEQIRAMQFFNSTQLISELPESFEIMQKPSERITDEIKEIMTEQEQAAKKYLEDSNLQARYSKHTRP